MAHYNKATAEVFRDLHDLAITRVRDANASHSGRNMDRGFTEQEIVQNIADARAALALKERELQLANDTLLALERALEAGDYDHYEMMVAERYATA